MRDIAFTLINLGILPFAVRYTWVGVLLWTWISLMNPHRLTFGFAYDLPWAQAAAVATLISLFVDKDRLKFPWSAPTIAVILFIGWMCLTTAFSVYPELALEQLEKVLKIQLFTLVAFAAIRERKHIELFVWVIALSIAFYGFKGGLFILRSGGGQRVWGPPGGFIAGNNEIGLAILMVIPLLYYLRLVSQQVWLRHGLLLTMILCTVGAIGTQSRGALVGITAIGAVLWWRAKSKFWSGVVILIVGSQVFTFMPESWHQRMDTITTYEQDSSAMGRINAWTMSYNLANDRFLGAGFETSTYELFAKYAPIAQPRAAHSIYFQILGEHGWLGLVLFLMIGASAFVMASRVRRLSAQVPDGRWLHTLAGMVQVSMVGYAVGGAFLSLAYFDLPYDLLVVLVACDRWIVEERWRTEKTGAFGTGAPKARIEDDLVVGNSSTDTQHGSS